MARQPQQATLETRLAELERQVRTLTTANRLRSSSVGEGGLRFYGGGSATFEDGGGVDIRDGGTMRVDGDGYVGGTLQSVDFDGDLDAGNVGTTGWAFNRTRAAMPELLLRPGSIGNDVLANPVYGDAVYAAGYEFAVTTTGAVPLASLSWLTPRGFTTANVMLVGRVYAVNSTAGLDYLNARSRAFVPSTGEQWYGSAMPLAVSGNNGSGINQSPMAVKVRGLAEGQEIRLEVQGWTAFANWAANAGNTADVAGQIIWTR